MSKCAASTVVLLAALMFSPLVCAQSTAPTNAQAAPPPGPVLVDGWGRPIVEAAKGQKAAPAPRQDLSGIWDPANGPSDGIQAVGAKAMPSDGKPEHELFFTPSGLEALNRNKPGFGTRQVPPGEINDPVNFCDPQGMPREDLYELRTTQILQTPLKIVIMYEYGRIWRVIWTDGRELPKDPEPRWFGYSVGKWVDDSTLVVQTIGTDERTWVDNAGRPHSGDLHMEERFHRVDQDHLELTVTLDDPKTYTKPWVALNKFPMKSRAADFDVREMICSPSEFAEYNKEVGKPADVPTPSK